MSTDIVLMQSTLEKRAKVQVDGADEVEGSKAASLRLVIRATTLRATPVQVLLQRCCCTRGHTRTSQRDLLFYGFQTRRQPIRRGTRGCFAR